MRAFGLVGIIIVLATVLYLYKAQLTGTGSTEGLTMGTNNPRAAADMAGVKNDLMAMAQAERAFMALNGRYATLEELESGGHIYVNPKGRLGYTYEADIGDRGFVIRAVYNGPATGMPNFSVNETMQISQR